MACSFIFLICSFFIFRNTKIESFTYIPFPQFSKCLQVSNSLCLYVITRCLVVLDSSTESPDAEELFIVDSSCPQHVGFLAFWCSEKEKQPRQDTKQGLLTLCCFPLHMKTEATKEISSEHGFPLYGEAKSARKLARGDQALFSLSNGLTSVDERIDRDRVQ